MNKTKGVLLFARNNGKIDYIKQAIFLAARIKKYLKISVAVVTDSAEYLKLIDKDDIVDIVISIEKTDSAYSRRFYDGSISSHVASFKNDSRCLAYDLTPYDETLLLDTDFILCNDILKNCFELSSDFSIYKNSSDVAQVRSHNEFLKVSDYSIDFYWATVIFFRKTKTNKIFFDLVKHIQDEWMHYKRVYQIDSILFRNDFAFSIAIHIMNGFQQGNFALLLPGIKNYSIDRDVLLAIDNDEMIFLVEKKDCLGEYTILKTKQQNVHIMNKFSLERIINSELAND